MKTTLKTPSFVNRSIAAVLLFCLLVSGCKPEVPTAVPILEPTEVLVPISADGVTLSPNLAVIQPEQTRIVEYSAAEGKVVLENPVQPVLPGSILASAPTNKAPLGMLKRVISVAEQDGKVVAYTDDASLSEAIVNGEVQMQHTLSPEEVQINQALEGVSLEYAPASRLAKMMPGVKGNDGAFNLRFDNVILYDADGNKATTQDQVRLNGTYSLQPDIKLNFNFNGNKFTSGKVTLTADQNLGVQLAMNVPEYSFEIELAKLSSAHAPMVVMVGGFPVVMHFEVPIVASLTFSSKEPIVIDFSQHSQVTGGMETTGGGEGWGPFSQSEDYFQRGPVKLNSDLNLAFSMRIQPSVIFYGAAGPKMEIKIKFEARPNPGMPCPAFYKSLEFNVGMTTTRWLDAVAMGATFFTLSLVEPTRMEEPASCIPTPIPPTAEPSTPKPRPFLPGIYPIQREYPNSNPDTLTIVLDYIEVFPDGRLKVNNTWTNRLPGHYQELWCSPDNDDAQAVLTFADGTRVSAEQTNCTAARGQAWILAPGEWLSDWAIFPPVFNGALPVSVTWYSMGALQDVWLLEPAATGTPVTLAGVVSMPTVGGWQDANVRIFAHHLESNRFYWLDVLGKNTDGIWSAPFVLAGLPPGSYQVVAWFAPQYNYQPLGLTACSPMDAMGGACNPTNELLTLSLAPGEIFTTGSFSFWNANLGNDISLWWAEPLP